MITCSISLRKDVCGEMGGERGIRSCGKYTFSYVACVRRVKHSVEYDIEDNIYHYGCGVWWLWIFYGWL